MPPKRRVVANDGDDSLPGATELGEMQRPRPTGLVARNEQHSGEIEWTSKTRSP